MKKGIRLLLDIGMKTKLDDYQVSEILEHIKDLEMRNAKLTENTEQLELWISGLSDAHNAVPEWIRNQAKAILAELAE